MQTDHAATPPFTPSSDAPIDAIDAIDAIAHCRQVVMKRASELLDTSVDIPMVERYDALPSVTGLLLTSLEELKVAEEELREQTSALARQRDGEETVVEHYRLLFLHAPLPAFVTDAYGSISEVNLAAAALFKRDAQHLQRKPLAALLAAAGRDEFRRQLRLITADRPVDDWRLVLHRTGDEPIAVHATVSFVNGLGPTRSGALYWLLRPEPARDR